MEFEIDIAHSNELELEELILDTFMAISVNESKLKKFSKICKNMKIYEIINYL